MDATRKLQRAQEIIALIGTNTDAPSDDVLAQLAQVKTMVDAQIAAVERRAAAEAA